MPHNGILPGKFGKSAIALAVFASMALLGCNNSDDAATVTPTPSPTPAPVVADGRPNILYIMADDLGYSDIHAFGGEIETPNLDALVANGRILTNHHTGTVSAITRAMLISGTDHHLVGEGTMGAPQDERKGLPGYEGYLNDSSLSVAQLLKDGGYHTYIAGKWHLGSSIVGGAATAGKTPDQWGFERSFSLLPGAAGNHFGHEAAGSKNYTEDGKYVQPGQPGQPGGVGGTPAVFYSTDFFTDKLISYIDANSKDGKPFFAYAAYTTPHWPLQVPEPWLSKYKGKYDQGYEAIAAARYERLQALGVIPSGQPAATSTPETLTRSAATANDGKAGAKYINALNSAAAGYSDYGQGRVNKKWASLSADEKKAQARYMEIYAGMVSNLDHNIGRLIQHLKDTGQYDNTFILFQSDNGAEGWPIDSAADPTATDTANAQPGKYEKLGTDASFGGLPGLSYGLRWAEVSATPFSQLKGMMGEGSISTPAIAKLPGQKSNLPALRSFTHVTDNTATFLALAKVTLPSQAAPPQIDPKTGADLNRGKVVYNGRYVYPVTGKSLVDALKQGAPGLIRTTPFGEETYGRTAIYSADGRWKARFTEPPFGPVDGHWELFDLSIDRGETNDLSAQYPVLTSNLISQWKGYMSDVGGVNPLRPKGFY
ncbi:Arylsulfatase [Andreprevotia sp. IGB-42]|uniref:arylsulfatase n=1 Tax=Andreprevotia sp. IGB-42 TaxID=2497473 RepID=UPI00157EBA05|nr:arylsulfatase [Andreprevotia sp. IGB-42]KAF0814787.1 Arylsulfatase [Andreprevotia sp. IGB-42]